MTYVCKGMAKFTKCVKGFGNPLYLILYKILFARKKKQKGSKLYVLTYTMLILKLSYDTHNLVFDYKINWHKLILLHEELITPRDESKFKFLVEKYSYLIFDSISNKIAHEGEY